MALSVPDVRAGSGVALPEARLAYRTFGSPDAPRARAEPAVLHR
jgi:hypothetical protein